MPCNAALVVPREPLGVGWFGEGVLYLVSMTAPYTGVRRGNPRPPPRVWAAPCGCQRSRRPAAGSGPTHVRRKAIHLIPTLCLYRPMRHPAGQDHGPRRGRVLHRVFRPLDPSCHPTLAAPGRPPEEEPRAEAPEDEDPKGQGGEGGHSAGRQPKGGDPFGLGTYLKKIDQEGENSSENGTCARRKRPG